VIATGVQRRHLPDLLGRAPSGVADLDAAWSSLVVDPVAQLAALDDLGRRGLLSDEEVERFAARIVSRERLLSATTASGPARRPRPAR
jgi:hypothetical protein